MGCLNINSQLSDKTDEPRAAGVNKQRRLDSTWSRICWCMLLAQHVVKDMYDWIEIITVRKTC